MLHQNVTAFYDEKKSLLKNGMAAGAIQKLPSYKNDAHDSGEMTLQYVKIKGKKKKVPSSQNGYLFTPP